MGMGMGHGVAVPWNDEDKSEGMGRVGAKKDESAECLFGTDGAPSGPWEIWVGDPNSRYADSGGGVVG